MSGGSFEYGYYRMESLADQLGEPDHASVHPEAARLRAWFAVHLRLCATAMHDIEWVDSGDYGLGDEVAAVRAVAAHLLHVPLPPPPETPA